MIIEQRDITLPDGTDENAPLIGWNNVVEVALIQVSSSSIEEPAVNLANPATDLKWTSGDSDTQYVVLAVSGLGDLDYAAIAGHNFGSIGTPVWMEGATRSDPYDRVVLHLNGADASTTITDNNTNGAAKTWTANGNAQIDVADYKFGGASLLLDGNGDWVGAADHADFVLGSNDFTIDLWFKCNAAGGDFRHLIGQYSGVASTSSFYVQRTNTNILNTAVHIGGSAFGINSTQTFTNAVNTGWHHLALVRHRNTFLMFIDGKLEGSVALTGGGSINDSTSGFGIGALNNATPGANGWNGWIDEVRFSVGIARWITDFDPPSRATDGWDWDALHYTRDETEKILLHFDGPDASNVIQDYASGATTTHVWIPTSGVVLDTAESKFGGASAFFDGTNDHFIIGDTEDWNLGSSDFTIEMWFKVNDAGGATRTLAALASPAGMAHALSVWNVERHSSNVLRFQLVQGTTVTTVTGTSAFTVSADNPGWNHVMCVRVGNVLRMFVNGAQEGGDVAFTGSANDGTGGGLIAIGKLGNTSSQFFSGWIDEFRMCVGVAKQTGAFVLRHRAFGDEKLARQEGDEFEKINLEFEGPDAATRVVDSNFGGARHQWTAVGNAQIDTAQKIHGVSSLMLDGVGDYVTMLDHADLALGSSDFTIEFWMLINSADGAGGTQLLVAGQMDNAATLSSTSFYVERQSVGGQVRFLFGVGAGSSFFVATNRPFTGTINSGWHHYACSKTGSVVSLFVDGELHNTTTASGAVNNSANALSVGRAGEFNTGYLNGWIDDFKYSVGVGRYTANFEPPARRSTLLTNRPVIFHWTKRDDLAAVRVVLTQTSTGEVPSAAVVYVGELLTLQRNIYVGHIPAPFGRVTEFDNNRAESGAFLGRNVTDRRLQSGFLMSNIEPDWYRLNMDPFVEAAADGLPFFWAWRPLTYPDETSYAWLINDPQPQNQRANGMMQIEIRMGALPDQE